MTIERRFKDYHATHPEVYDAFKDVVFKGIKSGKTRMSSKFIFELLRWEGRLASLSSGFENSFTSRYPRMFQRDFPTHADVFETRVLHAA